jgi:hypothetical protein
MRQLVKEQPGREEISPWYQHSRAQHVLVMVIYHLEGGASGVGTQALMPRTQLNMYK